MDSGRDIMAIIEARVKAARAADREKERRAKLERERKRAAEQKRIDAAFASLQRTRDSLKSTVEKMRSNVEEMTRRRDRMAQQLEKLQSMKRKAAASIDVAIGMVSGTVVSSETLKHSSMAHAARDTLSAIMAGGHTPSPRVPGLRLPDALLPSRQALAAARAIEDLSRQDAVTQDVAGAGRSAPAADSSLGDMALRALAAAAVNSLETHRVAVIDGWCSATSVLEARGELLEALARGVTVARRSSEQIQAGAGGGQIEGEGEGEGEDAGSSGADELDEMVEGPFLLHPGRVGGGRAGLAASHERVKVRGDWMAWLPPSADGRTHACTALQRCAASIDELVIGCMALQCDELKRTTLYRRSAMGAVYPGAGSRYTRHVDNPHGNGRVITALLYLNPVDDPGLARDRTLSFPPVAATGIYDESQGGHLRLHRPMPVVAGDAGPASDSDPPSRRVGTPSWARPLPALFPDGDGPTMLALAERCVGPCALPRVLDLGSISQGKSACSGDGGQASEWSHLVKGEGAPVDAIDIAPAGGRLVLFWSDRRCPHEVMPCSSQRAAVSVWYVNGEESSRAQEEEKAASKAATNDASAVNGNHDDVGCMNARGAVRSADGEYPPGVQG